MKQIVLSLTFSAVILTSFGQDFSLPKGTKLMGGTAEFRGVFPDENPDRFEIDLNPTVGIFIAENLAIGPGLNLAFRNTGDTDTRSTKFGISPLVRYYMGEGNMKIFVQGTAGYNWTSDKVGDDKTTNNFGNAGIGMGMAMFPVPAVGLDMSLNYLVNPRFNEDVNALMLRIAIFVYKKPMK